jgi:hypothetical protein
MQIETAPWILPPWLRLRRIRAPSRFQVISAIFPHNFFKDNSDLAASLNAPDQLHPVKAGAVAPPLRGLRP